MEFQRSKEWIKIELCRRLSVPCVLVKIDKQGNIASIIEITNNDSISNEKKRVLNELTLGIKESWKG
ncbi:hypothetical protein Q427_15325 [Halomonas sp. BC04]|nr:hypothetical protein Q427_15325 [Halomonas sp. BC04]